MATFQSDDGDVLEMRCEQIEVTSSRPRPDPNWTYTDVEGHEHRRVERDWPTLRWVVDEPDWVDADDEEYPGDGHYECTQCGEHIEPGSIGPSRFPEFIPGERSYFLNGEPIGREQAEAFIAAQSPPTTAP